MPPDYPSPDGHYLLTLSPYEMRMSHSIDNPGLRDQKTGQAIFQAPSLWTADTVRWSPESDVVQLSMRLYPGTKAPVEVWLYPALKQGKIRPETSGADWLLEGSLAEIEYFLDHY